MDKFDPLKSLKSMKNEHLLSLINHLSDYGIISTLEEPASTYDMAVKHWGDGCPEYLHFKGYKNEDVTCCRVMIDGDPTIYALYDADIQFEEVKSYVEKVYRLQNSDS